MKESPWVRVAEKFKLKSQALEQELADVKKDNKKWKQAIADEQVYSKQIFDKHQELLALVESFDKAYSGDSGIAEHQAWNAVQAFIKAKGE